MENNKFLEKILQQTNQLPKSKEKTIISDQITPNCSIFTLYGTEIDKYIEGLMNYRAINQSSTANSITKSLFTDIFKPSSMPKFNFMIENRKVFDQLKMQKVFGKSIELSKLFSLSYEANPTYYKAEIDGAIQVSFNPESVDKEKHDGYAYVEIKLFTAPIDERGRILTRRLQKKPLGDYFKLRHIFGLIGFSYLQKENDIEPVVKNDPKLEGIEAPNLWCIHLILMDKGILNDGQNAVDRAKQTLQSIKNHNKRILQKALRQKGFIFGLIYNLVKVIQLSQTIVKYKNELENKEKQLKRAKQRVAEEKQRVAEEKQRVAEEKQRADESDKRADKYLKKLLEMGIDPNK